ncbi:MAG: hypothetical protein Ct9H300mP19_01550 [Dehalococcoidia bacterium]|nr:MAG: hypothetical protein Ct9H300mP19_01550 [Dehalococcoidia bacterium]
MLYRSALSPRSTSWHAESPESVAAFPGISNGSRDIFITPFNDIAAGEKIFANTPTI